MSDILNDPDLFQPTLFPRHYPEDAVQYVNAYSVDRVYGGPEEGGWWYDAGEPLGSIPARTDDEIDAAKATLRAQFGPAFDGNRTRFSVIGDANLEIYVEDHMAEAYPVGPQHYE